MSEPTTFITAEPVPEPTINALIAQAPTKLREYIEAIETENSGYNKRAVEQGRVIQRLTFFAMDVENKCTCGMAPGAKELVGGFVPRLAGHY